MISKKTYIPAKPRNKKLIGGMMVASGSTASGGPQHSHANKPVIDRLTQLNIDVLSKLSLYQTGVEMVQAVDEFGAPIVDEFGAPVMIEKLVPVIDSFGNPVLDLNGDPVMETVAVYAVKSSVSIISEKEITAYGLGEEGGGGGGESYDMLLSWTNYSPEKSQWVISAALGKGLLDRIVVLEDGGSGGSNVEWGTESGGSIPLTVDSVAKSIALSTHTHSQYALSTHNHSGVYEPVFTKNTAFNKNFGTTSGTVAQGNHTHSGVYEPVFSKNTAFNKDFGTTSGTVAQGNDSRIVNGATAYSWGDHASAGYASSSSLANYALSTHNHSGVYEPVFLKNTAFNKDFGTTAGTVAQGNHTHSGVYEPVFTKNNAFNKNFGTTSGTVAQGDDSRIINGQTAYSWGDHGSAGYASSSSLANYVTLATTQTISGAKTFSANLTASESVTTPKVIFSAAGWSLEQSGTELQMKYNGTAKMRFLSGGTIVATQEITAYN